MINRIIMKDKCIVIPASLCVKTFDTLHSSHMGVTKTIEKARTLVFWPNMQKDIEMHLASCHPCAEHKIKQKPEPLLHHVPMVPWHSLSLDNFEYKGTHHLIVFDIFQVHHCKEV